MDQEVTVPPQDVKASLERILASSHFSSAPRLSAFLRLVVEMALEGREGEIKEYLIASEVYGRARTYDPRIDSIVRVEASRLRARLKAYDDGAGPEETLRIVIPKGSYAPRFEARVPEALPATPIQAAIQTSRRRWIWGVAGAAGLAGMGGAAWRLFRASPPVPVILTQSDPTQVTVHTTAVELANQLGRLGQFEVAGLPDMNGLEALIQSLGAPVYALAVLGASRAGEPRMVVEVRESAGNASYWSGWFEHQDRNRWVLSLREGIEAGLKRAGGNSRGRQEAIAQYRQAERILRRAEDHALLVGRRDSYVLPLDELLPAAHFLEQAIEADPKFGEALSRLAWVYVAAAHYDAALFKKGKECAERALALDAGDSDAHFAAGYVSWFNDWDFRSAARSFKDSLARSPLRVQGTRHYFDSSAFIHETEEPQRLFDRLISVAPRSVGIRSAGCALNYHEGRYREMEALARGTLWHNPKLATAHWQLGLALEQQGRHREAEAEFGAILRESGGDLRTNAAMAYLYATTGRVKEARAIAEEQRLEARGEHYVHALILAGLGEMDTCFEKLNWALEKRDLSLPYVSVDPRMASVRKDSRYAQLAQRLGLG